jgi:hypothetical protein
LLGAVRKNGIDEGAEVNWKKELDTATKSDSLASL